MGLIAQVMFILVATLLSCYIGLPTGRAVPYSLLGFSLAMLMVLFETGTKAISSKTILFAVTGATAGLLFSSLFYPAITPALEDYIPSTTAPLISHLFFGYLGVALALRHVERFSFAKLNFILSPGSESEKVLDTSILVDRRIQGVVDTNFLQGPFVVPRFVVDELQALADSKNPLKRERGRRGLACLEELLESNMRVRLDDRDFINMTVDRKLIALAKEANAVLMTVDFALQKVAQIHQVRTLNLNELGNLLKPPTYIGDELRLFLVRQGKEHGQGVGFLDDGTMVVVEHAIDFIGTEINVEVTSVIQTASGRMVFGVCLGQAAHPTPILTPAMAAATAEQPSLTDEHHDEHGDHDANGQPPTQAEHHTPPHGESPGSHGSGSWSNGHGQGDRRRRQRRAGRPPHI